MVKNFWIVLIGFVLVLSACTSTRNNQGTYNGYGNTKNGMISGVEWKLMSLRSTETNELMIPSPDKRPTLVFDADKGTVSGFGGCNRLMGPYEINGNRLKFNNTASTMMMCIDNMAIEDALKRVLDDVDGYEISNNQLMLKRGNTVLATYSK